MQQCTANSCSSTIIHTCRTEFCALVHASYVCIQWLKLMQQTTDTSTVLAATVRVQVSVDKICSLVTYIYYIG